MGLLDIGQLGAVMEEQYKRRLANFVNGLLNPAATYKQAKEGLQKYNKESAADIEYSLFGALPEGRQAAEKRTPMLGGPEANFAGGALGGVIRPLWHGSPHKFDKFSLEKIGTGEGAQAYGHGGYLAENPAVAKEYSKLVPDSLPPPRRAFRGQELTPGTPEYHAGTLLEKGTLAQAKKDLTRWIQEGNARPERAKEVQGWQRSLDLLNQAKSKADFKVLPRESNLYKAELRWPDAAREASDPLGPQHFLDWDKPLSQQPESVRKAFEPIVKPIRNEMAKPANASWGDLAAPQSFDPTGRELLGLLSDNSGKMTAQTVLAGGRGPDVSVKALKMGIPGIRYLDASSRGAGKGTANYVVFDDQLINLLERNGQPIQPQGLLAPKHPAPQDAALETARQNAVKLLGLPETNTSMDRARAMGFTRDVYHGTGAKTKETPDIKSFNVSEPIFGESGVYVSPDTGMANAFAYNYQNKIGAVYPLKLREDPAKISETLNQIRNKEIVVKDPSLLRSRFAAFDPARKDESDLLAGLLAAGISVPTLYGLLSNYPAE